MMVVVAVLMVMAVVVDEMDWVVNHASRSSTSFIPILHSNGNCTVQTGGIINEIHIYTDFSSAKKGK